MNTEIFALNEVTAVELFSTQAQLNEILEELEKEAKSFVPDISTKRGRDEVASIAYKVARSKTHIDNLGKDLVADWKKKSKEVDSLRKSARDRLDTLKDEVRKPLTDWENKEKERIEKHERKLADIRLFEVRSEMSSKQIKDRFQDLESLMVDETWEEFEEQAKALKKEVLASLETIYDRQLKAEEEKAELERLRKAEEERKQKEREEQIAREAAERARREAEEKARKEAEALEKAKADAIAQKEKAEREKEEAIAESVKLKERHTIELAESLSDTIGEGVELQEALDLLERFKVENRKLLNKQREMIQLLIECRDALPAISMASARIHGVDLHLGSKIEKCLEPWRVKEEQKEGVGS